MASPSWEDYGRYSREGRSIAAVGSPKLTPAASRPLVSVITVTLNAVRTIDRTIDSVRAQTHRAVEYIVIDGGSTDGTVDILVKRARDIDYWLSEPDRGISDAFNKGIVLAIGEYVAILNSDDWMEPDHLEIAIDVLENTRADFVFGNLMLHATDGKASHLLLGEPNYERQLRHTMPTINHPSLVCRRAMYRTYGLFDVALSTAMDYEWLLRSHQAGAKGVYVPRLLVHMAMEGRSNADVTAGLAEVRRVSSCYGYPSLLAWLRFALRWSKTRVRQNLEARLSRRCIVMLRRLVNRHYREVK